MSTVIYCAVVAERTFSAHSGTFYQWALFFWEGEAGGKPASTPISCGSLAKCMLGALVIHSPVSHYCHYTGDSTVTSNSISINFINVPRQKRLISFTSPSQMLLFASLPTFAPSSVFQRFYSFGAAIYSPRHPSINTITTPARPRTWARLSQWNENNWDELQGLLVLM